ncbi:hypothetical protein CN151_23450 [Sinorhizobium meliloti]|nr:hypothetical protein CN151_23450 [Sinorhizobium meliloti]RVM86321.1 hypothetical protein CN119_29895 [Sinorhizobium meliloti]RVN04336.1 hypothetical protein CN112_25685 [Sinorhizobium meliloti]
MKEPILETPDGRYIIVRGRLWRKANPRLPKKVRKRLVLELMSASRALKDIAGDPERVSESGLRAPTGF